MTVLKTRTLLVQDAKELKAYPALRQFLAPQRERATPVRMPKPSCLMCGGKVRAKRDFRCDDGTWLCTSCDQGPEVGMPRAA